MFKWNEEKDKILKSSRNITFMEIMTMGKIVKKTLNCSSNHRGQWEYHIIYNNYTYRVPFVEEPNGDLFLKTIIPDRKLLRIYKDYLW